MNVSILTEIVDDVNISRGASLAQMMINTSLLSEVMDEEKKEETEAEVAPRHYDAPEQNTSLGDSVQADMEALGAYRKTKHDTSFRSQVLATSSPVSIHTLGISPRATPINNDESVISEGDRLISTSLKNFLCATENNLASLLSSIDGIGTECVVQSNIYEEVDSYDEKLGLTPLRSRLEKVDLDAGGIASARGRALFSPLQEHIAEETKERFHTREELFSSHLETTTDLKRVPQVSEHDSIAQEADLSRSPGLNLSNKEARSFDHEPTSSILDESGVEKMIDDAPLSPEEFKRGLEFVHGHNGVSPTQSPIEQGSL